MMPIHGMNADEKWTRKNCATRDRNGTIMIFGISCFFLFSSRLMHTGVMDLTHSEFTFTFVLNIIDFMFVFITFIFIQRDKQSPYSFHWLIRWVAVWMWQCPKFLLFPQKCLIGKNLCAHKNPSFCVWNVENCFPFASSSAHVNISLLPSKSISLIEFVFQHTAMAIMIATFCFCEMLSSFNPLWHSIPFETFTVRCVGFGSGSKRYKIIQRHKNCAIETVCIRNESRANSMRFTITLVLFDCDGNAFKCICLMMWTAHNFHLKRTSSAPYIPF